MGWTSTTLLNLHGCGGDLGLMWQYYLLRTFIRIYGDLVSILYFSQLFDDKVLSTEVQVCVFQSRHRLQGDISWNNGSTSFCCFSSPNTSPWTPLWTTFPNLTLPCKVCTSSCLSVFNIATAPKSQSEGIGEQFHYTRRGSTYHSEGETYPGGGVFIRTLNII